MGQDDERRQLTGRTRERRVGRWVVERERGPLALGRELDRFGARDRRGVERHRARPAQHAGHGQGLRVEARHDGRIGRGTGQGDQAGRRGPQRVELGVRDLELADAPVAGNVEETVGPAQAAHRRDGAVGQEPVRRSIEDPGRVGELGLHRRQRLEPWALDDPVQVPPAAPVADQVERPVRSPLGLDDRLVRPAGGQRRLAERAVGLDAGDAQAGRVPGHVRVVPLEPAQARAVRCLARRRHEVGTGHEDDRVAAVERDGDDRVDHGLVVALAGRMILADRVEPASCEIGPQVGVAPRTGRRDRDGLGGAGVEPVQPSVGEVGEDDDPTADDVRAPAVLVGARPDVERRRGQVGRRAISRGADEHAPTGLRRATLEPVHVVAVDPGLAEHDDVADDVIDPDQRLPRPVGGDGGLEHPIRCRGARMRRSRPVPGSWGRGRCRARRA